jgi:hypothetical protein
VTFAMNTSSLFTIMTDIITMDFQSVFIVPAMIVTMHFLVHLGYMKLIHRLKHMKL